MFKRFIRRESPPTTPSPSPPPPAMENNILQEPWRTYRILDSGWNEEIKKELMGTIRSKLGDNNYNIAFVGPIGSGKSSIINSFMSIFKGDLSSRTQAAGSARSSYTSYFQQICGNMGYENVKFYDTMGIEEREGGILQEDIIKIAEGQIPLGYKFGNTTMKNSKVDENLRIHCFVYVLDAENVKAGLKENIQKTITDVITKMKHIRTGPNQMLLLTHIDCVDEDVDRDITNIFRSRSVKEIVEKASGLTGILVNAIFPVKCYDTEMELNQLNDIPLLLALEKMVSYSKDTIDTWREINFPNELNQQQCNCF